MVNPQIRKGPNIKMCLFTEHFNHFTSSKTLKANRMRGVIGREGNREDNKITGDYELKVLKDRS